MIKGSKKINIVGDWKNEEMGFKKAIKPAKMKKDIMTTTKRTE